MSEPMVPNPLEILTLSELRERTSMKWRAHPADVLPLWVAEMDVPLAEPVAQAVRYAINIGDTGYPAGTEYVHALASFAAERWGWEGFPADSAAVMPDVMLGIGEVLKVITEPGDPVIVNAPVYAPFYAFVSSADRRIVESRLTADGRIDLNVLESTFRHVRASGPRAVYLLSNPHNPTGAVHTASELTSVAALAMKHGVRVIADEIHAPLILAGATFTPYLSVPGSEDAFSLMSASKAWNLAGLKAAVVAAGPAAANDLASIPEEVSHAPSHLGVIAPRHSGKEARGSTRYLPGWRPTGRCWAISSQRRFPRSGTCAPKGHTLHGSIAVGWESTPRPAVDRGSCQTAILTEAVTRIAESTSIRPS